jgi:EcsC protein family
LLIPDALIRSAIEGSYRAAQAVSPDENIARRAGVKEVSELRKKPLEECDRLAQQVGVAAQALATVEGAATGLGCPWTTLVDVPLLFVSALRTIVRTGQCYGYPAGEPSDRYFNLGVLTIATAGSIATRLERLEQLQDLEELLIEETQVDMIRSELLSFLFQLEVFEDVPGIGIFSGAFLNRSFMQRVDVTARRVFQERWLTDNGKVREIAPAPKSARDLAAGWSGFVGRAAYATCHHVAFAASLPVFAVASLAKSSVAAV